MNTRNFSNPTTFYAGSPAFKDIDLFLKAVNIPGINVTPPEINKRGGAKAFLPADTIVFNELQMDVLVDEEFNNYIEMMEKVFKNVDLEEGVFRDYQFDMFVVATDTYGKDKLKWEFSNCRIQSIGDIQFDSTDETTEITFTVVLVYDYFRLFSLKVSDLDTNTL